VAGALHGLARFSVRRRFFVLVAWFVVTVVLVVVSHRLGDNTNDNLSLPGTDSQQATSVLKHGFPDQANGTSPIVLHAPSGKLTDSKYSGAVKPGELSTSDAQAIIDAAATPAKAAGLEVQTGGQLGQKVSKPATESSELVGIIAAMVILTFTFGTITAMLVPIITAIFGLLSTLAIIRILGHVTTVPTVAPTLATMIGLGVGIDYALFIVTRHFRGIHDDLPVNEAIARAVATWVAPSRSPGARSRSRSYRWRWRAFRWSPRWV
jgi:putative drug exporter of the RND superfamily